MQKDTKLVNKKPAIFLILMMISMTVLVIYMIGRALDRVNSVYEQRVQDAKTVNN